MRGRKAKALRRIARGVLLKQGKDINENLNEYEFEKNAHGWEPALDEKGNQMMDGDGKGLIKPVRMNGTIHHTGVLRKFYRNLKHMIQYERSNNYVL